LDLGVIHPGSILASVNAPALSSWTVVLYVVRRSEINPIPDASPFINHWSGSTAFIATLKALYSASFVDREMAGISFEFQTNGQFAKHITNPIRDLTHEGSVLSSHGHNPAKSLST
jgi:hypothetical protein